MTFTAVGSFITTDQKTFTWAPTAVGQVFPLIAITTAAAQPVTAVASSNATWVQCGTGQTLNGQSFTAWKGVATSTSSATVTLTSAAANGNLRNFGHAFSASGGGANVTFDALFTLDATTGATTSWPAATPGHGTGELLFGAEFNGGTAVSGSTSGYTYNVDATHGNGSAFDLSVGAATHPVWGDSDARSVLVILLYEAVTSHTATVSLTVTPVMSASRVHGNARSASLTVTPVLSASRAHVQPRTASLTITPVFGASGAAAPDHAILDEAGDAILDEGADFILDEAGAVVSHTVSASLTVSPSFSATRVHGNARSATLTVTPVLAAADVASHVRSASLTVTPSLSAAGTSAAPVFNATASLTVTPSLSAAARRTAFRSASLTVTPVLSASRSAAHVASASLVVTPSLSASRLHVHGRTASLTVTPVLAAGRAHTAKVHASLTVTPVLHATASHADGAPPGYPAGAVGAMVEFFLGTDWVDVTTAAMPDGPQNASITWGQPDGAQQPVPSSMPLTLDNPGGDFSPRNSAGPYFGQLKQNTPARASVNSVYGAYLRLENDDNDMASVADTSALHVTGSMELRLGARLSDWRTATLCARNDGATASWSWIMNSDGTLSFFWFDSGGTLRHVTSDASPAVTWKAFRVTMLATTGTVTFYVSDSIDGTWTQLGSALSGTSGAATTIRAGNSPLVIGWSAAGGTQMRGQVYGFRMYSGIGGTVVADAEFPSQLPGATTWTDTAGRTWNLTGGAELTGRDYRIHGELQSLAPTADVSSSLSRVPTRVAGRLARLQAGSAPTAESAMKRAVLAQAGSLFPVDYWTMEDGLLAKQFGAAAGSQLMTANLGTVQAAADSSFECSAPLPQLNGDSLSATVDTYTGGTAWTVRFLYKPGTSLPASNSRLIEVNTTGACTKVQVFVEPAGTLAFKGLLSGGSTAFSLTGQAFPQLSGPALWSVEATPSGGNVLYALVAVAPGASIGNAASFTVTGHGSFGNVTSFSVNADFLLTDTVIGHVYVQKAWASLFALGAPLNAWRTELAGDRFARVCAENGITCRILGRPSSAQAMGPQPRGSAWTILRDCAQTEQGLIFEPRDCFGLAFRTRESIGAQATGVTFDFSVPNLRGDLQPADDTTGLLNDVTGQMPDGTTWREVLDDGSARSVSEPPVGAGRYAGSVPFSLNVADAGELPSAVAFYLGRVSVDEPRYRNIVGDFGIPGAPVADMARLRPGDKIAATNVPAVYQSGDISQLAMSAVEVLGPGRRITWDGVPSSPYT